LPTLWNIVSILFPIVTIAPMQAIEMSDAMSAYSIAVAPRVHRINLVNRIIAHSRLTDFAVKSGLWRKFCAQLAAESLRGLVKVEVRFA
jgi:hypothetical protein